MPSDLPDEVKQWKEVAEDFLEDELQEIKRNYESN